VLERVEQQAKDHAQSIADTYKSELTHTTTTFVEAYQKANGSIDGIEDPLTSMLTDWSAARTDYKSEQIAGNECGSGTDQGTTLFLMTLLSGALVNTTTGEVISPDDYAIGVIPDDASNDICKDYAGQTFPLDQALSLPQFPIHANCPHEKILVPLN
jgi:hypothetical protein